MTAAKRAHLKIIQYDPNDYSLSRVFGVEGSSLGEDDIAAALSLYFQWTHYHSAHIKTDQTQTSSELKSCEINYDRDEAFPTELFVEVTKSSIADDYQTGDIAFLKIETFGFCFDFESTILDVSSNDSLTRLIITVPIKMAATRSRKIPRINISKPHRPAVQILTKQMITTSGVVIEMGLKSLKILMPTGRGIEMLSSKELVTVNISNFEFSACVVRVIDRFLIVETLLGTDLERERYFREYIRVVYSDLKLRDEIDPQDLLNLYLDSGYFPKDLPDDSAKKVLHYWEDSRTRRDVPDDLDIVAYDNSGKMNATGSISRSHTHNSFEYWFFQQMCSLKGTEGIEATGLTHIIRAEYLFSLGRKALACVNYKSSSRWIERIYAKHMLLPSTMAKVRATKNYLFDGKKHYENSESTKIEFEKVDGRGRVGFSCDGLHGGFGPNLLNANGLLNHVTISNGEVSLNKLKEAVGSIFSHPNYSNSGKFLIVSTFPLPEIEKTKGFLGEQPSDRYAEIPSDELLDFCGSVRHSIAITKRKFQLNAINC